MGICLPLIKFCSYFVELDIDIISLVFLPHTSNYKNDNLCKIFQKNGKCLSKLVEESEKLLKILKNINITILTLLIMISAFFIIHIILKCIRVREKYFFILIILKFVFIILEWILSLVINEKIKIFINDNKKYIQDLDDEKNYNLKIIKDNIFLLFIFSSCHIFITIIQFYFLCNMQGHRCYNCECADDCSFCYCSLRRNVEDIIDIDCNCRNCCFCGYILYLSFCFCKISQKNRISQFANNIDAIPQEIKDIIKTFEDKLKDLRDIINKDEKEIVEKFNKHLKERESKLKPQAKKLNEELEKLKKKIMIFYQKQ